MAASLRPQSEEPRSARVFLCAQEALHPIVEQLTHFAQHQYGLEAHCLSDPARPYDFALADRIGRCDWMLYLADPEDANCTVHTPWYLCQELRQGNKGGPKLLVRYEKELPLDAFHDIMLYVRPHEISFCENFRAQADYLFRQFAGITSLRKKVRQGEPIRRGIMQLLD